MAGTVIVCVDGSEVSHHAALAGLSLLQPADAVVVVTSVETVDMEAAQDASGFAGPAFTPGEVQELRATAFAVGQEHLDEAAAAIAAAGLGGGSVQTQVLEGRPGHAICDAAAELGAVAIVIGSRGRGRVARALLGSVSDHVVRHAPCPVVLVQDHTDDD